MGIEAVDIRMNKLPISSPAEGKTGSKNIWSKIIAINNSLFLTMPEIDEGVNFKLWAHKYEADTEMQQTKKTKIPM